MEYENEPVRYDVHKIQLQEDPFKIYAALIKYIGNEGIEIKEKNTCGEILFELYVKGFEIGSCLIGDFGLVDVTTKKDMKDSYLKKANKLVESIQEHKEDLEYVEKQKNTVLERKVESGVNSGGGDSYATCGITRQLENIRGVNYFGREIIRNPGM